MSNKAITIYKKGLIEFKPTQIVEIAVGDLSAPMETAIELTKMAVIMKNIWLDILQRSPKNEDGKHVPNPAALPWMKEFRMTVKDIHDMTKGAQEKVMLKKMDIMVYEKVCFNFFILSRDICSLVKAQFHEDFNLTSIRIKKLTAIYII